MVYLTTKQTSLHDIVNRSERILLSTIYEYGPINQKEIEARVVKEAKKEMEQNPSFYLTYGFNQQHSLEDEIHRLHDIGILQVLRYRDRKALFALTLHGRDLYPWLDD